MILFRFKIIWSKQFRWPPEPGTPEIPPPDPNRYTVRVYRSAPQTSGDRIAVVGVSLYGRLYAKVRVCNGIQIFILQAWHINFIIMGDIISNKNQLHKIQGVQCSHADTILVMYTWTWYDYLRTKIFFFLLSRICISMLPVALFCVFPYVHDVMIPCICSYCFWNCWTLTLFLVTILLSPLKLWTGPLPSFRLDWQLFLHLGGWSTLIGKRYEKQYVILWMYACWTRQCTFHASTIVPQS